MTLKLWLVMTPFWGMIHLRVMETATPNPTPGNLETSAQAEAEGPGAEWMVRSGVSLWTTWDCQTKGENLFSTSFAFLGFPSLAACGQQKAGEKKEHFLRRVSARQGIT